MVNFMNHRATFKGELKGIKTNQLIGLDFHIYNIEDRIKEVEKKLEEVEEFYNEYFFTSEETDENGKVAKEYYKCNLNKDDELSENVNICKYIETYANYLLNSNDLKEDKKEEFKILSEVDFKKQLLKEISTDFKVGSIILDTRPTNDYKNMDLKITKKDMNPYLQNNKYELREKDFELASVLMDYSKFRNHLREEMMKIKSGEGSYLNLYQIKKILSTVLGDMYDAKRMILAIKSPAKRLGDETPFNDFSKLDYSNPEHIKHCLKYCTITNSPQPDNMSSHIGYDLNKAIKILSKQRKIDDADKEIIECYNSGTYTIREIADEVERDSKTIQQRLDKICRRISYVI